MYFSVVLALVFVFVIKFEGAACFGNRTCEIGWLKDPGTHNCFRFFPAALSWTDARNSCVGQSGLLAVIPNNATNDFITKNVTRGLRTWIGLHNRNSSAGWQWSVVDTRVSYTNWAPGEPNNFLYPIYSEECVEIEDMSGKWNDETCDSLRSYVCQKSLGCDASLVGGAQNSSNSSTLMPVGTKVTIEARCRVGYRPINDTAETTCQADGTWNTDNFICEEIYCNDPSNIMLPNGRVIGPPSPYSVGAKIYYQCDIGYMLLGNSVSDCRDVQDKRIPFGIWDQPPICLKSPECETGWISHNNYCYLYVPELMSWHDADTRCQTLGGGWTRLVAIGSAAENSLVQQLTNGSSSVWIGLHDVPSEGVWQWLDGSSIGYKNFEAGEPNNGQFFWEDEDCVELDVATGRWNDEQCDVLREFVCEKFVAN